MHLAQQVATLGPLSLTLEGRGGTAELGLGLAVEDGRPVPVAPGQGLLALGREGAMVDTFMDGGTRQGLVDMLGPGRAPGQQQLAAVPGGLLLAEADAALGIEPTYGEQEVGMRRMTATVACTAIVDGEVDHHATSSELLAGETLNQREPILG
jgi:hypothetical protein